MTAHPLTLEQLEESHLLVIGQSRSGKTYQLRGAIEQLRCADRRVGAIDKVGNHWGLTLSADGTGPGLDFIIFGGKRAMVPMTPFQGAELGRLFVERNIPAIFDVSQWTSEEQRIWVADFADAVFRYNEGALHLAVDEAQSWMPINGGGPAFQNMLRIVEQGLGNGIRLMMSVQRLARLDATARGMSPLVVAMRQTSTIDRNAVAELMAIDAEDARSLKRDLPGLLPGVGYIWDPGSGGMIRHAFPRNRTFDSSRTPRHGDTALAPIVVSSTLVEELRKALAPAPANLPDDTIPADPIEALEKGGMVGEMIVSRDRRIAGLEAELARERDDHAFFVRTAERNRRSRHEAFEQIRAIVDVFLDDANLHADNASSGAIPDLELADVMLGETHPAAVDREHKALAGLAAIYPAGLTEAAWAARTGYSRKGGAWIRRRKRYLDGGLVEQRDGRWFALPAGVAAAGDEIPDMPPPGLALVKFWSTRLGAPGRILELLAAIAPKTLNRDAIAAEVRMAPKGGAFIRYIAELKKAELIKENGKRLAIAPGLMGDDR